MTAWVGISGYDYPGWRGSFYPAELPRREWLAYAGRELNSVELNGTFYSLKSPAAFEAWREQVPHGGFLFAIKGSRFITHMLKLRRCEVPLANFYASGVLALGKLTGPFLWQLPASFAYEEERLEEFLVLLPRTTAEAEELARHHDGRLRRGALVEAKERRRYRHAFEVRHPSYFQPPFYEQLRRHRCALVLADTAGKFPYAEELTADFVYVRLHGSRELYASGYDDGELDAWAKRLRGWAMGPPKRDVYVYFDNDAKRHAPHDARRLAARLGALPHAKEAA
ncbi:MAG TPA: DUF72 domain-containing protein [Thermoanaerobaculia bacterium]|jgi:uncharacterized protein YecE (DUF72 family)|nr:DUF72 domain-containing protein [Thermoanaerobaculia bacterium]